MFVVEKKEKEKSKHANIIKEDGVSPSVHLSVCQSAAPGCLLPLSGPQSPSAVLFDGAVTVRSLVPPTTSLPWIVGGSPLMICRRGFLGPLDGILFP